LKKDKNFKNVIPSKIFELAAMEKPILLGVEGESRKIIEKYRAGLSFEPENKNDLVEKILYLKKNKKHLNEMKKNCTKFAKDYNRNKLAMDMLKIINNIASINRK